MIEEIMTTIKAQLYERVVSPLMGSFIFSWALWNYKLIVLLISEEPVIEKYRIINEVLYTNFISTISLNFIFPIVTALLYLFLYPYPAKYVYQFNKTKQKEISDIKRRIEEESLLSVKESQTLRRELNSLQEEYEKLFSKKDSEIEFLKSELVRLQSESSALEKFRSNSTEGQISSISKTLTEAQEKILIEMSRSEESIAEKKLLSALGENVTESKYNLGVLETGHYIKRNYASGKGYVYDLLHPGRAYLVQNKLL